MASPRFAWGIDIGNRALKAVKLVRTEAGLHIDDFEVIEHEHVLSNAGDNKESLIQSALTNFVQRHPVKGGGIAAVSVSGVSSFARFIKLPPVEDKQIPKIVSFEAIQQIPFPLEEVEWSYQLFRNPDSPDVEVGIFAMKRDLINAHIKHFTDVDLNVQCVQMNPLAVYNAMYHDNQLKGTTMIVDLGAENTDLIIADGETIWLRSIPIGGNNFTDVLVKSFKLQFGKAEELKRNANTSKYARQIFQAMRPVFSDLVAEIQRSIGFYSSVHRDSQIKRILALGGTFRLAGLQKYLQQNLQLDVSKLSELAAGAPDDAKLAATFNQNLLSLVSAYGLAIQAMGDAKITSSLLPQHIRREKMWKDKTKWFGAAAACFLLGTGVAAGGYFARDMQLQAGATVQQNSSDLVTKANSITSQWSNQVTGKGGDDRQKIINLRSMTDYRTLWPNILADIYKSLPQDPQYASPARWKIPNSRGNLKNIWINSITTKYTDDLNKNFATLAVPMGFAAPATPPGATPGQIDPGIPNGAHGFYVMLTITTPNAGGFIYVLNNSFVPILKKMDMKWMDAANQQLLKRKDFVPSMAKNFYVGAVFTPLTQAQLFQDKNRPGLMAASEAAVEKLNPQPANGVAGGAAPAAPGAAPANNVWIDRLTGEDRRNDWTMQVPLIIVISDTPVTAPK